MRRKIKVRKSIKPDSEYKSATVSKFINYVMKDGKKSTARKVVYDVFSEIKDMKLDPMEVLDLAIKNTEPLMEVRSRRIGGATYQVPREVRPERRFALAIRWILLTSRSKKGMPMKQRLATELVAASKNEGDAVKKRENTHKMAEANRAFAHFAW